MVQFTAVGHTLKVIGVIVDRYIIIDDLNVLLCNASAPQVSGALDNPHETRILVEHSYVAQATQFLDPICLEQEQPRRLPQW